jgi:hypothetical protein
MNIESKQHDYTLYSTSKLNNILSERKAYPDDVIDIVKDTLIMRGESFQFDQELIDNVNDLDDKSLKEVVEKEWKDYTLEYITIARKEYLKRGYEVPIEVKGVSQVRELGINHLRNKIEETNKLLTSISNNIKFFFWLIVISMILYAFVTYRIRKNFEKVFKESARMDVYYDNPPQL